jgi:hypothetical protein
MILLKPDGKIDLEHRAYFLRGAPPRTVVIAAAEDGQLSIISPDLKKVQWRRLPPPPSPDNYAAGQAIPHCPAQKYLPPRSGSIRSPWCTRSRYSRSWESERPGSQQNVSS